MVANKISKNPTTQPENVLAMSTMPEIPKSAKALSVGDVPLLPVQIQSVQKCFQGNFYTESNVRSAVELSVGPSGHTYVAGFSFGNISSSSTASARAKFWTKDEQKIFVSDRITPRIFTNSRQMYLRMSTGLYVAVVTWPTPMPDLCQGCQCTWGLGTCLDPRAICAYVSSSKLHKSALSGVRKWRPRTHTYIWRGWHWPRTVLGSSGY